MTVFEGLWVSWGKIRVWRTWDVHYHASVFNQWYLSLKCPWQPKFSQEETPFLQTRRLDRVGERAPSSLRDLRLLLSTRSKPTFSGQRWWTCICSPWSPRLLCHWGWGHVDITTRLLFVDWFLNLKPDDPGPLRIHAWTDSAALDVQLGRYKGNLPGYMAVLDKSL